MLKKIFKRQAKDKDRLEHNDMSGDMSYILEEEEPSFNQRRVIIIALVIMQIIIGLINSPIYSLIYTTILLVIFYKYLTKNYLDVIWVATLTSVLSIPLSTLDKSPLPILGLSAILFYGLYLRLYNSEDEQALMFFIRLKEVLGKSKEDRESGEDEIENGVRLCYNAENREPVYLYDEDRFLHMLILGPTGSGKTSQIILPMINQDLKRGKGITVIEPKGDLAEKVYAMGKIYNREVIFFDPAHKDCPYFNPLYGDEVDVIENIANTLKMLSPGSSEYFVNMNDNLTRNSVKVLKRLYDNNATIINLYNLIWNVNGIGKKMITEFQKLSPESTDIEKENAEIASWFLGDYFNEKSKTYEHCSGVRSQVQKLVSNKYLRRILNPPSGQSDIDFTDVIENEKILAISTAQGVLRDLSRYLGYFIILNYQSSVFRRPGDEDSRVHHFLYIDEFQTYANPGFSDMLTQGRSYRVASTLATQNRGLIGMNSGFEGKAFTELVSTNARNLVLFPGMNALDAKYYSDEFGEYVKRDTQISLSQNKYDLFPYKSAKETIRETEKVERSFSPSDLIYQPFGTVHYKIIQQNSLQAPGRGLIKFIPKDLNEDIKKLIRSYRSKNDEEINRGEEVVEEVVETSVDPLVYLTQQNKEEGIEDESFLLYDNNREDVLDNDIECQDNKDEIREMRVEDEGEEKVIQDDNEIEEDYEDLEEEINIEEDIDNVEEDMNKVEESDNIDDLYDDLM